MIPNQYLGHQGDLNVEGKTDWQRKVLWRDCLFYHGGPMGPHVVKNNGLDAVAHGKELIVDKNNQAIDGGKLVFAFFVAIGEQVPDNFDKVPAARRLWGGDGHGFIFLAPQGTLFWSRGQEQPFTDPRSECAFAYKIEPRDIKYYCTPDTTGMKGQRGRNFQVLSWQSFLTADQHA